MAQTVDFAVGAGARRRLVNEPISDAERQVRVELAAAYRLAQLNGWDELIYNHISARVPGTEDHFLINPYGLSFDEVTASNLVKVDLDGNIIGSSDYPINGAGFTIHSAIHGARHDAGCVLHLHTEAGVAVSMLEEGLLPMSQTAMLFHGNMAFHEYEGIALDLDERKRLIDDLGDKTTMILRNHGTLVVGKNVAEAFTRMYLLEKACKSQLQAMACNVPLHRAGKDVADKTGKMFNVGMPRYGGADTAWAAMMRRLDRIDTSYKN
ncbi:MAG TPA: class II aldolase/adducin family protein [Stellaceae bacterium]|nr:class II aldolase/adducin family protein [Stellaceae bacterium]